MIDAARWVLVVTVIALEIPYPLVHGSARDTLTVVTVVVFATAAVVNAAATGRWWHGPSLLLVVGGGAFAAEALGVHTGYPFGRYRYLRGLGPSVAQVPVVVPLAWVMMAQPSAAVARRLARSRAARIVVGAAAMSTWDIFLDPQLVYAGHWRWFDRTPHLPGVGDVPLSNLGGWLLVTLVLMAAMSLWSGREADDPPSIALWVWTWLGSTVANLAFFDRPWVALWGFVGMGVIGVPLSRQLAR